MSIRSPVRDIDSTFFSDFRCNCCDGIYYIYLENDARIPEHDLNNLITELKATMEDAIKLERYLKRMYNASVSIKVVRNNTDEIFVVDEEKIEDFTNIYLRIRDKFLKLFKEKVTNNKSKNGNHYIFLFFLFIFLTGAISLDMSDNINDKKEMRGEDIVVSEQQRFQQWNYNNPDTRPSEIP